MLLQTLLGLFHLVQFDKCWQIFLELNSERLYQSSGKEKESRCLVRTSSTKRENRHFYVVVVQRRLRHVQKSVMHVQNCCFANLRACLHGGGGPQIGEATCSGSPHLSCKRDQIKMRDYMDRQVTPSKRFTSPNWGPPPPCKQALNLSLFCRSRLRYRRRCLSSQLKTPWGLRVNAFHSNSPQHWKFRGGSLEKIRGREGCGVFALYANSSSV